MQHSRFRTKRPPAPRSRRPPPRRADPPAPVPAAPLPRGRASCRPRERASPPASPSVRSRDRGSVSGLLARRFVQVYELGERQLARTLDTRGRRARRRTRVRTSGARSERSGLRRGLGTPLSVGDREGTREMRNVARAAPTPPTTRRPVLRAGPSLEGSLLPRARYPPERPPPRRSRRRSWWRLRLSPGAAPPDEGDGSMVQVHGRWEAWSARREFRHRHKNGRLPGFGSRP